MIFTYECELKSDVFHRNYVASKIQCDRRTRRGRNLLLGYPFHQVRYSIIRNGGVDFDRGHRDPRGDLSPEDLVALYSYLYLPRHHAEVMSSFDRFSRPLESLLCADSTSWIVDLGCGPGTAGLALTDHYTEQLFHYLGIDRSDAMRRAARNLLREARNSGLIHEGSHIATASDRFNIPAALKSCSQPTSIVFVASYLFASKSLDTSWVSQSLQAAVKSEFVDKCIFVYINSTTRFANRKYETFVRGLGPAVQRFSTQGQIIQYRRYAARTTGTARFVNDCLLLKGLS
jgi:SAM-dependent methyltransferase